MFCLMLEISWTEYVYRDSMGGGKLMVKDIDLSAISGARMCVIATLVATSS